MNSMALLSNSDIFQSSKIVTVKYGVDFCPGFAAVKAGRNRKFCEQQWLTIWDTKNCFLICDNSGMGVSLVPSFKISFNIPIGKLVFLA